MNSFDIKFPSINALTDAGKIEQMRRYLYQLVEQLNWALNSLENNGTLASQSENKATSLSNLSQSSKARTITLNKSDAVIDEGVISKSIGETTVNWHYRKWKNGNLECWCKRNITTSITYLWGASNLYFGTANSIDYPFEFIEKPITQITCECKNEEIPLFVINCGVGTSTYANSVMICAAESKTDINCNILYLVYGKWK